LLRAEVERVLRRGTADLDAFDCYLRALPGYYSRTPRGNGEAITLLEVALARDPHFALATALLGRCVATSVWLGAEANYASGVARALSLARAALNIDRTDPQVLSLSGHLLAVVGGEHAEGGALLDLAD
jgi:adenylate cyclase